MAMNAEKEQQSLVYTAYFFTIHGNKCSFNSLNDRSHDIN